MQSYHSIKSKMVASMASSCSSGGGVYHVDAYDILGVGYDATEDDIKKAYKRYELFISFVIASIYRSTCYSRAYFLRYHLSAI